MNLVLQVLLVLVQASLNPSILVKGLHYYG